MQKLIDWFARSEFTGTEVAAWCIAMAACGLFAWGTARMLRVK